MKKTPGPLTVQSIDFVGDQNGPSERDLKRELSSLFSKRLDVLRAYLASVKYEDGSAHVALCIRATGTDFESIVTAAGEIFYPMFNQDTALDFIQLNDEKESRLKSVCQPFFEARDEASRTH